MHETGRGTKAFDHEPVQGKLWSFLRVDDLAAAPAEGPIVAVVKDPGAVWLRALADRLVAVICTTGTPRSHVGILAGSFGIPCMVGTRFTGDPPPDGTEVEVDCSGEDGVVRA
jgi:phosphoenolpyruvate-protein kinase (PTS system EI component)